MIRTAEERAILAQAKAIRDRPKANRPKRVQPIAQGQRQPRERDPGFLAWLRRQRCIAGCVEDGCSGPIQAAHVRFSDHLAGRRNPGMQSKPSDFWCVSLCEGHHLHDQHTGSEKAFWDRLGIDPADLCPALHTAYLTGEDGPAVIARICDVVRRAG